MCYYCMQIKFNLDVDHAYFRPCKSIKAEL